MPQFNHSPSGEKIDAIYELRKAAENKGRAEQALEQEPSTERRDALLDAHMVLEKQTIRALEVCHECGHEHEKDQPHHKQT